MQKGRGLVDVKTFIITLYVQMDTAFLGTCFKTYTRRAELRLSFLTQNTNITTQTRHRETSRLNYDQTISLHLLGVRPEACRGRYGVPRQRAWSPGNPTLLSYRHRDLAWNHAGIKWKRFTN